MQESLRNAIDAINGVQIPELPEAIILLESEINSRFANTNKITEIISENTTLSGQVMQVINSPVMRLTNPVKSIRGAVNVMGLNNIYNLVVCSALMNLFGNNELHREIMKHSVGVAFCMADISEHIKDVSRDQAYMLGLFHNVGALMLASKSSDLYTPLFHNSLSLPVSISEKEEDCFGSNHSMIGVLVAKKWHLPADILSAIMLHHNKSCAAISQDRVKTLVAMIKTANGMVSEIDSGAFKSTEMKSYEQDGMEVLNLPEKVWRDIRTDLMSYVFKA